MKSFLFFILTAALLVFVSCSSSSKHNCPTGYSWDEAIGDCKQNIIENPDETTDTDGIKKDGDTPKDGDAVVTDEPTDADTYTGSCSPVGPGETIKINIIQHKLTIGTITVAGAADSAKLKGELWGENSTTLSAFKIADINSSLSGKSFAIAEGSYNIYYKGKSTDTKISIKKAVPVTTDTTLDIDLPLYEFKGKITKNDAAFPVLSDTEKSATKVKISSKTYTFEIPYADFAGFTLTVPSGKYTAAFEGYLKTGGTVFKGAVLTETTAIDVSVATEKDINIKTVTYSGNITVDGAAVPLGKLAIVKQPPLDDVASIIADNASTAKTYSIEMIANDSGAADTGMDYWVIYYPDGLTAYSESFQRITQWTTVKAAKTLDISLDFGRIHGKLSFNGGAFPDITKCADPVNDKRCTRGKLKIQDFNGGVALIKNLGISGTDYNYDAVVVRRTKYTDDTQNPPVSSYIMKEYTIQFESSLNDISKAEEYQPFTFDVQKNLAFCDKSSQTCSDTAAVYTSEKSLDFDISPKQISGTITHNKNQITVTKDDMILLRDTVSGIETAVINLKNSTDGSFSFYAPTGEFDILYKGSELIKSDQKIVVDTAFSVTKDLTDKEIDIKSNKLTLNIKVNGKLFFDFASENTAIDHYEFIAFPEKAAQPYVLNMTQVNPNPYIEVFSNLTWSVYIVFYVKSGTQLSTFRFPVAEIPGLTADSSIDTAFDLTGFSAALQADAADMSDATDYRGILNMELSGKNKIAAYFPSKGTETAVLFAVPGDYKSPVPSIMLNEGFDIKQEINIDCIHVGK